MSGGSTPIRILPVDDHPIVREGIAGVLGVQPEHDDGDAMDIQMPEMNGLDALIAIRTGFSDAVHGLPISQIGLIASLIRGHRVPSTRTSETPWPVRIRVAAHDASSPTQISLSPLAWRLTMRGTARTQATGVRGESMSLLRSATKPAP